ncbi:hypothetical protein J421_0047 [Gemmatirosa kalamazoonensis]|uniref:Uncharacterized protein n=1 Tax=Gemmatirosa kalamazoonensis TaxID=861299 RepID=W0RB51_9BACT|nr:hypothetical protein [Gemmatirosa kalamazoonensis]AHG87540.1 hypothetical protein J421_0002 [Gemmatirosa kalamazoonensis]AHG87563.1 hypothetical protein J421_0025 [Gemmatirosa kalamazoonensis]AHG87584.1 hypothetical protein J421_0047 [Gemmatirosa kalamazoonensis]
MTPALTVSRGAPTLAAAAGRERGGELLERGVYLAPYLRDGRPVLLAIDDAGELRAARTVPADWPLVRAIGALEAQLERIAPSRAPRRVELVVC